MKKLLPLSLLIFAFTGCQSDPPPSSLQIEETGIEFVCKQDCPVDNIREEVMLDPVPPNTPCTRIYGGPETATISGISQGKPFQASFNKSGGCEIERWNSLVKFLKKLGLPEEQLSARIFR